MPYILGEIQVMSAKVVAEWAATADRRSILFEEILLGGNSERPTYITPTHMAGQGHVRYHSTLYATGAAVMRAAHGRVGTDAIRSDTTALAHEVAGGINGARWLNECLRVDLGIAGMVVAKRLIASQKASFGRHDLEWLRWTDVGAPGALWRTGDSQLRVRQWTYCGGVTCLGDLVAWH